MDELEDGHEMIDYKLSRRGLLPPDPLQLHLYQLGLHAETGCTASRLSFYDLRSNRKNTIEACDSEESTARIRGLCRAISVERRFEPSEGVWCELKIFRVGEPVLRRKTIRLAAIGRSTS